MPLTWLVARMRILQQSATLKGAILILGSILAASAAVLFVVALVSLAGDPLYLRLRPRECFLALTTGLALLLAGVVVLVHSSV
jgi:hypothetical protein